jgi:hypothetical protein
MARTELPSSIEELRETILRQESVIAEQASLITFYREWKRLIDSQQFGSRSEKLSPDQGHLFNEAETLADSELDNEGDEIAVPAHTRARNEAEGLSQTFFRL